MGFVWENVYKGNAMLIPGVDDEKDEMDNLWT